MRRLLLSAKHVFDSRGFNSAVDTTVIYVSFLRFILHLARLAGYRTGSFFISCLCALARVLIVLIAGRRERFVGLRIVLRTLYHSL